MGDRTSDSRRDVAVVIPAAGSGLRLGGMPKQFRLLGGKPLLEQTVRALGRHPAVFELVAAVPEADVERLHAALRQVAACRVVVVPGGQTRQESVHEALLAVDPAAATVLVHDAVRPFVSKEEIGAVIEAARQHGAASLAVAVVDTLRRSKDEMFGETVSREALYRMQTPQGFRRDVIERAHDDGRPKGESATDDIELAARVGFTARLVEGSTRNIKITTQQDWELAEAVWPDWERVQLSHET